jgi:hypothetical protein
MANPWKRTSVLLLFWTSSRTSFENGSFLISRSVVFWYFLISLVATVPYLERLIFLIPWLVPAVLRTALRAIVLRGAFVADVLFLAVCLVLAI